MDKIKLNADGAWDFNFATVEELVAMGKESRDKLVRYIHDVEEAIGKGNEMHPDWMDNIFTAVEELGWGWDDDSILKELGWA